MTVLAEAIVLDAPPVVLIEFDPELLTARFSLAMIVPENVPLGLPLFERALVPVPAPTVIWLATVPELPIASVPPVVAPPRAMLNPVLPPRAPVPPALKRRIVLPLTVALRPAPKPAAPAPVKITVPPPVKAKLVPAPERAELMVLVLPPLLMVAAAPRLMVPVERIMLPELSSKVMLPASTVPVTVMVPAARPSAPVPKFTVFEVVLARVPETASVPAADELQRVAVDVHVPPAVPKPAVVLLLSQ